jgi:hypothetical protein
MKTCFVTRLLPPKNMERLLAIPGLDVTVNEEDRSVTREVT